MVVEDEALDQFRLLDGATELADQTNVGEVHRLADVVVRHERVVHHTEDRVHGHRREQRGVLRDHLRVERRARDPDERLAACQLDGDRAASLQQPDAHRGRFLERFADRCRVDAFREKTAGGI